MVAKKSQSKKRLRLLVVYRNDPQNLVEYADTPSELKQLEDRWTGRFSDLSLPNPNFEHWEQEAKEGKWYALFLKIEKIGQNFIVTQEAISKDRYEAAINLAHELCSFGGNNSTAA